MLVCTNGAISSSGSTWRLMANVRGGACRQRGDAIGAEAVAVVMLSEINRVLQREIQSRTSVEVEIADYERPFASTEEFLANVEQREWINLQEIDAEVRDPAEDGLRITLTVSVSNGLRLTLRGGRIAALAMP